MAENRIRILTPEQADAKYVTSSGVDALITSKISELPTQASTSMSIGAAALPRLTPASLAEKAKSGVVRGMLYGMSISSFDGSPVQMIGALMERHYGRTTSTGYQGFVLGGSYTTPQAGWVKQKSSNPGYGRAVADNTATPRTYTGFGDRLVVEFSRESDSVAANITVDGVVVGQTPTSGSQQYTVRQEFVLARGTHTYDIPVPASAGGKVYFERSYLYDSESRGVLIIDNTLGGSTLGNMLSVGSADSQQATPVPTVGDNGINAHFDRDDIDFYVLGQDVNDAGSPSLATYLDTTFIPTFQKIVQITKARRKPLVLVSSMAGHYAMANDGGGPQRKANYERIRSLYAAAAAANNHITHIDWHEATKMDYDLVAYQSRYYPTVTNLNVTSGTYSGDFIHPNATGLKESHALAAQALGVPAPREDSAGSVRWENTRRLPLNASTFSTSRGSRLVTSSSNISGTADTITFPAAHGLVVGDQISLGSGVSGVTGLTGGVRYYVVNVPDALTIQVSTSLGGSVLDIGGGNSSATAAIFGYANKKYTNPVGGARRVIATSLQVQHVPYYRDTSLYNQLSATQTSIDNSSLQDRWGKYIEQTALTNPGLAFRVVLGEPATLTIRALGSVEIRLNSTNLVDPNGVAVTGTTSWGSSSPSDEPSVFTVTFTPTAFNQFVSYKGEKIYDIALTHGTLAALT